MANIDNSFSAIRCLSVSNSDWINKSQDSLGKIIEAIREYLDNIEYVIKDVERSGCDISDLENIYSVRLDVYEAIVDFMTKINENSTKEIEIERKMYEKGYRKYKDVFEALKQDPKSQI